MPDALALYIHWPFCKSKCPYCDFNSHVRERVEEAAWREALLKEMAYFAGKTPGRQVVSVFFGGGTPSLMPAETVAALLAAAERHWGFAEGVEITLEANPTSVEASRFAAFRAAGVNRVSLGVQALDAEDLKFLGRGHSVEEALAAVELAAKHFPRYSFDLIYARPGQSEEAWAKELVRALGYADGHLSLYQLTIEENTAFHHAHAEGRIVLPPDEAAASMYERTQAMMAAAGMPAYEISNHAKPGQESRHNLAYWQGREYVGVGPGAHGRLDIGGRVATQTIKSPERWLEAVGRAGHGVEAEAPLTEKEMREERVMMRLRLVEGFARGEMPWITDATVERLVWDGLIEPLPGHIQTTLKGRLLLNQVTAALLD